MTQRITIVGGGATGTLLAVNLLKYAGNLPLEINIIEKKNRLGRGVAYSSESDFHLLNVPAGKMGAFPDDVEHFHKWLTNNFYSYAATDFVPRKIYGEYLSDVFRAEIEHKSAHTSLNFFNDEAIDIIFSENSVSAVCASGKIIESDKLVLAFGNFLPSNPEVPDKKFLTAEKYTQNPWDYAFFNKLKTTDEVLLIGTGLTMADAALSLYNRGHKGKILAVSRHGLLPETHRLGLAYPSFEDEIMRKKRILPMLKIVRRHIAKAAENSDWRAVIDSLRPFTQNVWRNLSLDEKQRFMRHLNRFWNVARHRIPNECGEILDALKLVGRLEIDHGRIRKIQMRDDGKFLVSYGEKQICVDAIINCTGSQTNFEKLDVPFVKNLLKRGFIRTDALSLGLDALPTGEIIDKTGKPNPKLYTIGTALKGILWESTAMPELRLQAKELALRFLPKVEGVQMGH